MFSATNAVASAPKSSKSPRPAHSTNSASRRLRATGSTNTCPSCAANMRRSVNSWIAPPSSTSMAVAGPEGSTLRNTPSTSARELASTMLPRTSRISSVRRGRAGAGRAAARRASNARSSMAGSTAPWNSGETTGSSNRRRASGDRCCHFTLCGATRRSAVSLSLRSTVTRPREVDAASRFVPPLRSRSTTAAMTRPLFGRPPCFSPTYQAGAPGRTASASGTVPSPCAVTPKLNSLPDDDSEVTVSCRTPTMTRQRSSRAGQLSRSCRAASSRCGSGRSSSSGQDCAWNRSAPPASAGSGSNSCRAGSVRNTMRARSSAVCRRSMAASLRTVG